MTASSCRAPGAAGWKRTAARLGGAANWHREHGNALRAPARLSLRGRRRGSAAGNSGPGTGGADNDRLAKILSGEEMWHQGNGGSPVCGQFKAARFVRGKAKGWANLAAALDGAAGVTKRRPEGRPLAPQAGNGLLPLAARWPKAAFSHSSSYGFFRVGRHLDGHAVPDASDRPIVPGSAPRSIVTFCSTLRLAVSITICSRFHGW